MKIYINLSFTVLILALANVTHIFAQTCQPVAPNLVSWYSGDNNALDSRSRNNGAFVGTSSFSNGKVGQAFNFNGSQSVQAPDDATLDFTNAFTIEMWVNPPTAGAGDGSTIFISKGDLNFANTQSYAILFNSNRQVFNRVGNGLTLDSLSSTSQIPLNTFTHIATTYDGSTLRIYINGALDNSQATSIGTLLNTSDPLFLGGAKFSGGTILFPAVIDETSLYNRALSASEIAAIANAGNGGKCKPTATLAPSGQVAWLAGDGDARDIVGTNDGTLQNGAGFSIGKIGQSFNLDGTDDSVRLPLTQTFQNFTLESWVKPLSAVNDPINQELILGQAGFGSQMGVRPGTNGGMRVVVQYRDTINSFAQVISTSDIPLNDWSYLVGTFDGTTLKLYINGVLNVQSNPTNTTVQTCNTPYFIGGFQTVTDCNSITNTPFQFFNGLIDEASVYNRALTDAEITSVFNAGIAGKLKQNRTINKNSLVSLYRAENNANDAVGTNSGTLEGVTFAAGKVGMAFNFTAQDQSVSIPNNPTLFPSTALSVEAWVNPTTYSGCAAQYRIFHTVRTDLRGYATLIDCPSQTLRLILFDSSGTANTVASNATIPAGTFTHFAATWDGSNMRLYINGVLDNTAATTISSIGTSSDPIRIGNQFNFGFIGQIDEPALYNRALTAAEIRANYQAGNALSTVVGDARVTFPTVMTAGTTQQIPLDANLFPAPTMATPTGLVYDIATNAAPTANAVICFNLPAFTPMQFSNLRILHFVNNEWIPVTDLSNSTFPTLCTTPLSSFSPFAIVNNAPTAAAVSIGGRARYARGKGISRAQVSLTDAYGTVRQLSTDFYGRYRFDDVPAGETYIISVNHKFVQFTQSTQVRFIGEDDFGIDFTAIE